MLQRLGLAPVLLGKDRHACGALGGAMVMSGRALCFKRHQCRACWPHLEGKAALGKRGSGLRASLAMLHVQILSHQKVACTSGRGRSSNLRG
mmetsp:Transcript_78501/g.243843  ORF Transcript_78501/g.243843 Transcript_78501/m.243843 type:complete len:92 (+) Transcript_78501:610-885(+)